MVEHRSPETHGGSTPGLRECRRLIESLAGEGWFVVTCARTGEPPAPAAGLRFPNRRAAATAARLTVAYRATLREWDPETPWRDPVVRERRPDAPDRRRGSRVSGRSRTGLPSAGGESSP
jgi:hypothetical protein